MVDVSRDPRWGRVSEGSGEDAYLGSQIAKAMVRGINKMICQKQFDFILRETFSLYGASEAGRDYNTVDGE
jgi:beta-glucosidase